MDVNVDLPPKMSDSVAGMFNPFCLTQIKEIFSTNPGYVSDGFVEIFKHENFIILFFCKIAYFIIDGPFMWKFFVQILKFCLTVLMRRNAFFIELDNVFSDMNNRGVFSLPWFWFWTNMKFFDQFTQKSQFWIRSISKKI